MPIGFRQLRITHYALRIGKHRDPASSPPRFSRVFFPFFRGGGLQSGFPVAYYAARPFPGRCRLFGNGTAQCDVREPGLARSHNIPAGSFPRGLLKNQNLNRQVKFFATESLILAQNERWRHGLGMQVERPGFGRGVAKGCATRGEPAPGPGTSAGNGV